MDIERKPINEIKKAINNDYIEVDITNYLLKKGFYKAYEPAEQVKLVLQTDATAISLSNTLM